MLRNVIAGINGIASKYGLDRFSNVLHNRTQHNLLFLKQQICCTSPTGDQTVTSSLLRPLGQQLLSSQHHMDDVNTTPQIKTADN